MPIAGAVASSGTSWALRPTINCCREWEENNILASPQAALMYVGLYSSRITDQRSLLPLPVSPLSSAPPSRCLDVAVLSTPVKQPVFESEWKIALIFDPHCRSISLWQVRMRIERLTYSHSSPWLNVLLYGHELMEIHSEQLLSYLSSILF